MTTQVDYCRDEWDLILGAPGLIALLIIETEQWSQPIAYQQLRALMAAIEETTDQGAGSALIQAVTDAVRAGQSPLWPTECPRDLIDLRGWALAACRQVGALLGQRVPEAEAEAYAHWLMRLGQQMVLAPADAECVDVDARQRAILDELAAALDLPLAAATPLMW